MNTTVNIDPTIVNIDTTAEEYPVLDTEEIISVAAAKQKLDWEGTPAYKRKMLQVAYQAANRRANVSPIARSRNRAKNKQARASRKRNRR